MKIADLHAHPSLYTFHRLRNSAAEHDAGSFHPWNIADSDARRMARGARATHYSQADPASLSAGQVRLMHASLTPIETGFFGGGLRDADRHADWAIEVLKLATGVTAARAAVLLATQGREAAISEALAVLRNQGPLRQALHVLFLDYPMGRVRHLISGDYDYFDELQREYDFLRARDGQHGEATAISIGTDGQATPYPQRGRYELARDPEHLDRILARDDGTVAFVLSIEGAHVFTMHAPDDKRLPEAEIFDRIEQVKRWEHPVMVMTLAHHFDNGICGHARSLIDMGQHVMDQSRRLDEGLEHVDDLGIRVVRHMLDLDDDLNDRGGRRMVIDGKHMSARSRREFYDRIVRPYNARHAERPADEQRRYPRIPVVMSHIGYNGIGTLDELVEYAPGERDDWHSGAFNAWSINACDEDVRMVHASGGMLGICLDRRIAGAMPGRTMPRELELDLVLRQVLAMVDVIWLDDRLSRDERRRAWDMICLGTDFDGVIHPVAGVPTAAQLPSMFGTLAQRLEQVAHTRDIAEIGVDTIVRKLAYDNLAAFTRAHFPAACGVSPTEAA